MIPVIPFEEGEARLDWLELTDALAKGHELPKAEIGDTYLYRGDDTILNRSAWIDGMGIAVKSATVFPGNPQQGKAVVNGGVTLYSDSDGTPQAIVDFHLLTKWKTAGDSLLAARKLARPDSRNILIMGAGTVGHSLVEAYRAGFPEAEFTVWNRTAVRAQAMAERLGMIGLKICKQLSATPTSSAARRCQPRLSSWAIGCSQVSMSTLLARIGQI